MNGRQSKRIRRLAVLVAGADAPDSVLVVGVDRVLEIRMPKRKDGKRSDYWKRARKASKRKGYVCRFLGGSLAYARSSREWTRRQLKRAYLQDRAAFVEIEQSVRDRR